MTSFLLSLAKTEHQPPSFARTAMPILLLRLYYTFNSSSSTFLSYRTSTTTSLAGQVSILCTFSAPSLSCWPKTEDIVLSAPENPPFSFAGSRYQPKSTKATVISLAGQESLRSTISRHSHPSFYKQKLFTKYLSLYILSILQYRIHRQSRPESWASSSSRTKLLTTPHLPSSDCALPYWLGLLPFQPPSTRFDTMCCFRNIWNNVKAFVANFSGITGSWDDWVPQDRIRKDSEENRELAANLKAELTAALKPRPMASSTKKKAVGSDVSSMRGSEERQTPVTGRGQKRGRDNEIEKVGDSTLSSERPKKRHRKATEYHTRILKSNEDPSASPLNVDYSEGKATKLKVGEMQTAEKEASTKWSMQKDRDKFTTEFPDSCLRRRPSSPSQNNDPDPPKRVDRPLLKRKRSTGSLDSYWEKEKAINESYIKPPAPDASYLSTLSGKDYLDKKGKQKRWIDNDLNGPSTDEPKPVVRAAYAAKRPMIAGIPLQETPKDLVGRVSKKRARVNSAREPNKKLKWTDVEAIADDEIKRYTGREFQPTTRNPYPRTRPPQISPRRRLGVRHQEPLPHPPTSRALRQRNCGCLLRRRKG